MLSRQSRACNGRAAQERACAREKSVRVRDLVVRESLERLAQDAGERLRELVAEGEELPYDVTGARRGLALRPVPPQTTRFVRAHATALLDLDSFGPACSAIASAEIARSYLERLGEPIPNDPGRSAADAVVTFLCRVWEGSAEFPLDAARIEAALGELEDTSEPQRGEAEVARARARASDAGLAPRARVGVAGARRDDRRLRRRRATPRAAQRSAWEPLFFAVVQRPMGGPEETARAPGPALRELVTALRLFKPGSVGMGPHGWARSSGDRWRRISTGAGRPAGSAPTG